jgi:hypothetical protein
MGRVADLRFRTDWAGVAEFTLISAISVCHLRQIRGYYTRFGGGSKGKSQQDKGRKTQEKGNGGFAIYDPFGFAQDKFGNGEWRFFLWPRLEILPEGGSRALTGGVAAYF